MAYFGLDDQIFNIINVEDQTVAIFNWEWWKVCILLGLYLISASVALCGQVMIIIYIVKYAPKGRPINEMILVDQVKRYIILIFELKCCMSNLLQSSKFIFNVLPALFALISIVVGTPITHLYGDHLSWIISGLWCCYCVKQTLGGFFVAIYRIICLKRPEIAMSLQNQRKLRNNLLCLELTTMVLLMVYFYEGATITGTEPSMELLR